MKSITEWIGINFATLLLSLALAVSVWIIANQQENPVVNDTLNQPIPIEISGLADGLIISNDYTTTTRVSLRAQQNTWLSLSPEDVVVTANLDGLAPGTHQVPLDIDVVNTRAAVDSARPNQIRIIIEELAEEEFDLQLITEGVPASGFEVADTIFEPDTVVITGPKSLIDSITEVEVMATIEDLRNDFVDDLQVIVVNEQGEEVSGVTVTPSRVATRIPISQQPGVRDFAIQVPTIGQPADGYFFTGISVSPNIVTLEGSPTTINSLGSTIETQSIDLSNLATNVDLTVALDLPPGVQPAEGQPGTVDVVVSITPQQGSRLFASIPVRIIRLSRGLAANVITDEVEVLVTGPLSELEMITSDDIDVVIDLSPYGVGIHFVEPTANVRFGGLEAESILPSPIEVRIEPVRSN